MHHLATLQKRLIAQSDPQKKHWWENYVKHNAQFYGVSMPTIRLIGSFTPL